MQTRFGAFCFNEFVDGMHVSKGAVGQPNEVSHGCAGTFPELHAPDAHDPSLRLRCLAGFPRAHRDRKSTRLNSSHGYTSYAVFGLKKKNSSNRSMLFAAFLCKTPIVAYIEVKVPRSSTHGLRASVRLKS